MRLFLVIFLSSALVSYGVTLDASRVTIQAQQEFHLNHINQVTISGSRYVPPYEHTIRTRPIVVSQPRHPEQVQEARRSGMLDFTPAIQRVERLVSSPDVEDQHTLSQLARMSGNAYALPGQNNWYDMDIAWNNSFPYGWEDPADGFRGHVFRSSDNSTVVLSIKGTTLNGPTSRKDKFNDNLLFSCCCGRVAFGWRTVCGCYAGRNKCDAVCLSDAMIEESLFYSVGVSLVTQLLVMYPDADIWLVGHSLGGSLASLLGATFGLPAVAFEAPGEKSAARHLHLPIPQELIDNAPVTHVYHNADPIPMGTCNGALSVCAQAGYALETRCHLGKSIIYDTIGELGWVSDVRHHPIRQVITKVIEADHVWGEGHRVPPAQRESDCYDCTKWEYDDFGK